MFKTTYYPATLLLWCVLSCSSCALYVQKPTANFIRYLNDSLKSNTEKLRFDGAYHYMQPHHYHYGVDRVRGEPTRFVDTPFLGSPIFFLKNNMMALQNALMIDSTDYIYTMKNHGAKEREVMNDWGVYTIQNDTLKASLYIIYTGYQFGKGLNQRLLTNFEGYVKNKDTIQGWHMIPPLPKIAIMPNQYEFDFFMKPRDLVFKKVPVQDVINPNEVWINRFKTK